MEDLENARKELDKTSGKKAVTQKMFRVVYIHCIDGTQAYGLGAVFFTVFCYILSAL